jgi:hypothetical protein
MTITLKLSLDQESRLRARAAQQDARAVREILLQAVDSAVEGLLGISVQQPQANTLPTLLDKIATELRDAPELSEAALSRAGIYSDHL